MTTEGSAKKQPQKPPQECMMYEMDSILFFFSPIIDAMGHSFNMFMD